MKENTRQVDVLIVGGGPAGASAALSLVTYSELEVALVEQSDFSRMRVGEHVSPSMFDLLDYLKIEKADFGESNFLPVYGSRAYWGSDQPSTTHSIFTTEASTFQLDREQFDLTLIEAAADRGATIFPRSTCTKFEQMPDKRWAVSVKHPDHGLFVIHANYLVDATGRTANVCRHIGVQSTKYDSLMGVGAFLSYEKEQTKLEQTMEAVELGWWYAANLPDNKVVVTLFTDADIIAEYKLHQADVWNKALSATKQLKKLVGGAHALQPKPWVRNAQSQKTDATQVERFIAIGDAVSSFDPISSMGIGFSMSAACHAARHIQHTLTEKGDTTSAIFQNDINQNFEQYLQLRNRFYQQEKRWSEAVFWKRRNI